EDGKADAQERADDEADQRRGERDPAVVDEAALGIGRDQEGRVVDLDRNLVALMKSGQSRVTPARSSAKFWALALSATAPTYQMPMMAAATTTIATKVDRRKRTMMFCRFGA